MRLIQLLGDGIEELYTFDNDVTDEEIKQFYKQYKESDSEDFEEYLNEVLFIDGDRVFVDEIYVD